jgi:hypothetical protein
MKRDRRTPLVRVLPMSHPPSTRVLEVIAAMGMGVEHTGPREGAEPGALLRAVRAPGTVALVTGPSGGGKSRLLRALRARLISEGTLCVDVAPVPDAPCSLLDALGTDAQHAARCLSAAGLGDATLWVRSPTELSDGERARLAVACAWDRATRDGATQDRAARAVLLWDECASVLDRTTARSVCVSIAKLVRRGGVSLVCATAHDDVHGWLAPDTRVWCGLGEEPRVTRNEPQRHEEHEEEGGAA